MKKKPPPTHCFYVGDSASLFFTPFPRPGREMQSSGFFRCKREKVCARGGFLLFLAKNEKKNLFPRDPPHCVCHMESLVSTGGGGVGRRDWDEASPGKFVFFLGGEGGGGTKKNRSVKKKKILSLGLFFFTWISVNREKMFYMGENWLT